MFDTGHFWKGVWSWLIFARCLEVVTLGKALGTGQFGGNVCNGSFCETCMKVMNILNVLCSY
jgi:hypothetical protein